MNQFHPSEVEVPNQLLWCGRFFQEKKLKDLIEAIKIIITEKKYPQLKKVLTGDGLLQPIIHRMVKKHNLETNIIFSSRLRHKEIPTMINKASIYVLPSLQEGMPQVLLEAMACGKPVIGSDIPGINDLITHGENGLLIPPRNPKALSDAISTLLMDGLTIVLLHAFRGGLTHNAITWQISPATKSLYFSSMIWIWFNPYKFLGMASATAAGILFHRKTGVNLCLSGALFFLSFVNPR